MTTHIDTGKDSYVTYETTPFLLSWRQTDTCSSKLGMTYSLQTVRTRKTRAVLSESLTGVYRLEGVGVPANGRQPDECACGPKNDNQIGEALCGIHSLQARKGAH